jgi:methylamine dehydrogenase accessory protein MauD
MDGVWLISYLALWGLTLLLALAVLAHSRLLGLLHYRFGPAVARPMADGPAVGTRLDRLTGTTLDGAAWAHPFPAPADTLLVFVSPQCQTCNELLPHVTDFARTRPDVTLVLVSTLDHREMNRAYVAYRRLERVPYVIGAKLADELDIEGTPYALHLDRHGVVTAKGLVNNYEHLVSLFRPAARNGDEWADGRHEPQLRSTP